MRRRACMLVALLGLGATVPARATDVPIIGLKLIVVDKTVAAGKAKVVFVSKDGAITKGTGTDAGQIESTLDLVYDAASGAFDMPQGGNWIVNSDSVAKYVNKDAPVGGGVKVSVIKPASLLKVVGRSLGDAPLDISTAPTGSVYVADTIVNGGETMRLCTQFTGCVHQTIAGGTGYKLVCKGNSTVDPACTAIVPLPVSFTADVQPIFNTYCVVCHSGPFPPMGLNLSAGVAYGQLVSITSAECPAYSRVEPGLPGSSYLIFKLQGFGPCFTGGQMPLFSSPLAPAQIQVVSDWILEGALNN